MTNLEQLEASDDRRFYVYAWFYKTAEVVVPFYVGKGSGVRYKSKSGRSKRFLEFLATHDCFPQVLVQNLTESLSYTVEKEIKQGFANKGVKLLDGEHSKEQRKKSVRDGIDAMQVINGKKISSKTGHSYGRPVIKISEEFLNFLEKQKSGLMTVQECCDELGISRSTWYSRIAEVRV